MTLQDVVTEMDEVIEVGDYPTDLELKKWRNAVAEASKAPGQDVADALAAENARDDHDNRIVNLECELVTVKERLKLSNTRVKALEKEMSNVKQVLTESGFTTVDMFL